MTAANENERGNNRLLATRFVYGGIGLLLGAGIVGCNYYQPFVHGGRGGDPNDSPITIRGGSIHFKAKNSGWQPCTEGSNTCYTAVSKQADKKKLKYYHFIDENLNDIPVGVTSPGNGWEVDVVDTNPGNQPQQQMQHGVLICAESLSPFTSCNPGAIMSDSIYVIATGGGTFAVSGSNGSHLIYHDGNPDYDYINDIRLNATNGSSSTGMDKPCDDSVCRLFLDTKK